VVATARIELGLDLGSGTKAGDQQFWNSDYWQLGLGT
jgi:hypothetical protein